MKFFSIKWKLSIAFVLISLVLVGIYVIIATQTFESDKISYVFDNQQKSTETLGKAIGQKLDQGIFIVRAILATYDANSGSLSPAGNAIFEGQNTLLALQIWSVGKNDSLLKLEKQTGILSAPQNNENPPAGKVLFFRQSDGKFLVTTLLESQGKVSHKLRMLMDLSEAFQGLPSSQIVILSHKGQILFTTNKSFVDENSDLSQFIKDFAENSTATTLFRKINGEKYLVSVQPVSRGELEIISIVAEKTALGALQVLYKKSIVFMLFSLLGTILASFLLAATLTINLKKLSFAAEKIGQGDFSFPPDVKSKDEMGVLSKAFEKMGTEISRLLLEMKDKGRMEAELKTARLVQESLLPAQPSFMKNEISLSGVFATSSECGGDWWYYYEQGDFLYVMIADATGHGTPSALITAAARSLFSKIETQEMSLLEIAKDWDQAIAACSRQKVFMTALMLKINTKTGQMKMLNASHEPPMYLTAQEQSFSADFVALEKGSTLGEKHDTHWTEMDFQLEPGSKLLLYTDGIFAVENAAGKTLGEKRVMKTIEKIAWVRLTADSFISDVFGIFDEHRGGNHFPDDITMVVVQRRPAQSSSDLARAPGHWN